MALKSTIYALMLSVVSCSVGDWTNASSYTTVFSNPHAVLYTVRSQSLLICRDHLLPRVAWTGAALVPTVYQQKSRKGRRAFPSLWKRGIDGFRVLSIFLSSYQRVFHYWSSLRVPFEPFNPSSTVHRELHWI